MKSKNYRRINKEICVCIYRYIYEIKKVLHKMQCKTFDFGGESGIRTHDRELPYANFQDWCLQPLDHLSNK